MSIKKWLAHHYRCSLTLISPKLNTAVIYKTKFGKRLDLNAPETLNEKILWLKFNTYWNNELVKQCADKYAVRSYVKDSGCGVILNQLLGIYRHPEDIPWDELPKQFAIKLNVGCGYNHIVFDKTTENISSLNREINRWLKKAPKTWLGYSEIQYKDVEPLILIEKYLGGQNGELPEDYKFYCINGKCYMIMYCKDRDSHGHGAKYFYLDREWNNIANTFNDPSIKVDKPGTLSRAIEFAEKLSLPFPFVRVDFYLLDEKIVFGELTFTPAAGMDVDHKLKPFSCDEDIDHIYGRILRLPKE